MLSTLLSIGEGTLEAGFCLIIFGSFLVFMMRIALKYASPDRKKCSHTALATITGYSAHSKTDDDGYESTSYSPEYKFTVSNSAEQEVTYRDTTQISTPFKDFAIGEQIMICYDPNNPKESFIVDERFKNSYKIPIYIFIVIGTVMLVAGVYLHPWTKFIIENVSK